MTHYSTLFTESANATLQIPNTVHVLTRRHHYNPIFAQARAGPAVAHGRSRLRVQLTPLLIHTAGQFSVHWRPLHHR